MSSVTNKHEKEALKKSTLNTEQFASIISRRVVGITSYNRFTKLYFQVRRDRSARYMHTNSAMDVGSREHARFLC